MQELVKCAFNDSYFNVPWKRPITRRIHRFNNNNGEIFISRLVPETTTRDVINYVTPRLNRTVRVKQLRAKYDGYALFILNASKYLKNKVINKAF